MLKLQPKGFTPTSERALWYRQRIFIVHLHPYLHLQPVLQLSLWALLRSRWASTHCFNQLLKSAAGTRSDGSFMICVWCWATQLMFIKSSGQMHEDLFRRGWWGIPSLRGQPDDAQNPPVWEPPQWCLETPGAQPGAHTEEWDRVPRSLGRPGKKCPLSASQCQPGPLAAGIQYSIEERLRFPSACLVRLVLKPHTAGQPLS